MARTVFPGPKMEMFKVTVKVGMGMVIVAIFLLRKLQPLHQL
jgi:hypothetical protein